MNVKFSVMLKYNGRRQKFIGGGGGGGGFKQYVKHINVCVARPQGGHGGMPHQENFGFQAF